MGGRRFRARLGDAGLQPPSLGLRPPSLLLIASQTQSCVTRHLAGQEGVQILALLGDRGKSFNFWPQFPLLFTGDNMNTHLIELLSDRLHTEGPQNWQLQVDPKIHTGLQGTRRAKTILKKTATKFEDFLPDFRHMTKLQLPQQGGCGVRTAMARSGLEQSSQTSPHICGRLGFDNRPSLFSEKGRSLQQMAPGQLDIHTQKNGVGPPPHRINSK